MERPVGAEDADIPKALACDLVDRVGVLLRIRHKDLAGDVLDAERRKAGRDAGVDECVAPVLEGERAVVDVDVGVVEVSRVEVVGRADGADREALVDGAVGRRCLDDRQR